MSEALLRPQSSGTAILTSGSASTDGKLGVDGTTIFLKVQSSQFNLSQNATDTTGDGDAFATYDHNNEMRGQISLRGFMLASEHIGIEKLTNIGSSADLNPMRVVFTAGIGTSGVERVYDFKMMVVNVVIDWNRLAGLVGVAIQGQLTGSVGSSDYAFFETTV